jgi:hypothetical protein
MRKDYKDDPVPLSLNLWTLTSCNTLGHSRPVTDCFTFKGDW